MMNLYDFADECREQGMSAEEALDEKKMNIPLSVGGQTVRKGIYETMVDFYFWV